MLPLDFDAYFDRIGYAGPRRASFDTLEELHERHVGSIPFENLDVRLGRPILLDIESLQRKLVASRRGGYCFEQNALFAAALLALGFEVTTLEARVGERGIAPMPSRTHMLLRILVDGNDWLADVGFGGDGPLRPVPFGGGLGDQPGGAYRVAKDGSRRVMQRRRKGSWIDLYSFGLEPAFPIDFEVANHFTSTNPGSAFVRTPTVQLSTPRERLILRGRRFTTRRGDEERSRDATDAEIPNLLRDLFGLNLPEDDVRRAFESSSNVEAPVERL